MTGMDIYFPILIPFINMHSKNKLLLQQSIVDQQKNSSIENWKSIVEK